MDAPLLAVEDLSVHYFTRRGTVRAVQELSLSLRPGETLGLIGESGSGKSTLVSALLRFVSPPGRVVSGRILFDGMELLSLSDEAMRRLRGRQLAMVFQAAQNALNPVLNVGRQIAEVILEHESVGREEAWRRARAQLERVGIDPERVRSYPHEFSGGMRQRVMIAIATACDPRLLILDEPVTGLDVVVQHQLLGLIRELRARVDLPVIFITHDLAVITETCSRVAVMYAGRIVEEADTVSLYRQPRHPYSRLLVQSYPSIRGERRQLASIPGAPPSLLDPPPGCSFHPRCPLAGERCRREQPAARMVDGHRVACHEA